MSEKPEIDEREGSDCVQPGSRREGSTQTQGANVIPRRASGLAWA